MKKLLIYGTGRVAELAYYYFSIDSPYSVVAFIVSQEFSAQKFFCGRPVVSVEDVEELFPPDEYACCIALSYAHLNSVRKEKYYLMKEKGYPITRYISSKAIVLSDAIGENCLIFEGSIIQPFAKISDNVIIWSGSHVGHHSTIGEHSFLAPQVAISGCVTIKNECFIGINATVRDNIIIASRCIIGAGSLVLHDTLPEKIYVGSPAQLLQDKNVDTCTI